MEPMRTAEPLHYYAPPQVVRGKLLLVGGMVGLMLVFAVMAAPANAGPMFVYGLGLLLVCEVLVWALMRFNRLTISDEGVRYRSLGHSVFAAWHHMIGIRTQRVGNAREVDGLALRERALEANGCLMFLSWFSYSATLEYRDQEYFLPISNLLSDHWWTSPFADELRRRAPQLFTGATD